MEKYPNDVRIVWKNNALPFHNRAMPAAQAAMAAHAQGKFWEFHAKIFEQQRSSARVLRVNQHPLDDVTLEAHAKALGLDVAKWKAAQAGTKPLIEKDMDLAQKVRARGTPNFFVNGRNLRGAVPFEDFDDLIQEELEKAKKLVAGGTAAKDLYAKIIANGKTFEPLEAKATEFNLTGRPCKGNPKADITVVEFSDFQCPYCSRIAPAMAKLTSDPATKDRVKVCFKQFPLNFHKQAKPAAIAALAANEQGKFWEYHDKVFADYKNINEANIQKWATELQLDMAKFNAFLKSGQGEKMIAEDMADGSKAGVRGTPSVYINGRKYQGGGYAPKAIQAIAKKYFPKK